MANIPDALPQASVQGYRPSMETAGATDLGLGELGASLEKAAPLLARRQREADRAAADPHLLQLQTENEVAFKTDAAAYHGETPGFAADQIAKAQARAQTILGDPSLKPGVRHELTRLAHAEVTRIGQQAIAHEASTRAQPILDAQRTAEEVGVNGGVTAAVTSFAPAKQELLDGYDGSTPGLTAAVGAAFDQAAAPAIAATPERLRPALQARLSAMRVQEVAGASIIEAKGQDAYVLKAATDQASTSINTVVSNPLAYDNVVRQVLPGIVETMPKGLKKDALRELTGQAAVARVRGLVDQGHAEQAGAELADGRYDAFLDPHVKEDLSAHVEAAKREKGPKSFDQWMAAHDLESRADAETYARLSRGAGTGQVDLDQIAAQLGPAKAAEYATRWKAADQAFAAGGAVHDMPAGDLRTLAAKPAPEPTDPDYATRLSIWQTQQQAAQAELKARAEPGQWAYTSAPAKAGRAGSGAAQDRGAALQQGWIAYQQANGGPERQAAGKRIAGLALGVQEAAGLDPGSWQLVPQSEAARLAAMVVNAPPEQKLAQMQALAGLIHDLPTAVFTKTGQAVSPQAILAGQLRAAHLSDVEISAIVDFGPDPAKLGRYVAALNDPTLKPGLPGSQGALLKAQVAGALKPFLDSVAPLPGAKALEQARIDRTILIARGLMAHQGMNPGTAAQQAARDMTEGYRYVDTWRIPAGAVPGLHLEATGRTDVGIGVALTSGVAQVRQGAATLLHQLTADRGAGLYAPAGAGAPDDRRRLYALQLGQAGRWVTAPDDGGLVLMAPHPDGTWDQVADRYGRPVRASWSQLQGLAQGRPSPFAAPPHTAPQVDGKPVAAASTGESFKALAWAVTGRESGFRPGQESGEGALGLMQVTPATVHDYAPRLGLPVDLERAKNDPAYNRKIGEAALSDHLQHFGGGAGIGLALAAYNAGKGRVEGYRDPKTNLWHPGWLQTLGDPRTGKISLTDWAARIPYKETRDYVQAVLPVALRRLQSR